MLKINPISPVSLRNYNHAKTSKTTTQPSFKAKNPAPPVKEYYTGEGEFLRIMDNKKIFNVEDITTKKIGSKFILTPTAPEYKGLRILVSPDTVISSTDKQTGAVITPAMLSFKGKVYGSIREENGNSDKVMEKAYRDFFNSGNASKIAESETPLKGDYNFYVPSDGDGTRYRDITTLLGGVTKPASRIPAKLNGEDVKLVQVVLSNFAKTGKMENFEPVYTEPAKGSAYAFLEGLASGQIPTDKPVIFSWGDNFSDIDIKKLVNYHNETKSDFTMLTLPVDSKRIQSLGAVQVNSQDDLSVKKFKEKPEGEEVKEYIIPGTEKSCLGVVGPYVISPKVLESIKENYINDKQSFKDPNKGFDFSASIIERMTQEGEFKIMAYPKPETDTWSDLGSGKDFKTEMRRVKEGKFSNLPQDIRETISENIDNKGNISFDQRSQAIFESFCDHNKLDISNAVVYYNAQ